MSCVNAWAGQYHYVHHETGWKGKRERREFSRLFEDAAQRRFDLVLF
jgi:frataxin-like iron-binding protein CyaY